VPNEEKITEKTKTKPLSSPVREGRPMDEAMWWEGFVERWILSLEKECIRSSGR